MSIISQQTWDIMPQEEKDKIREVYYLNTTGKPIDNIILDTLETLFDKENLQPEPSLPKTWEEIEELLPEDGFCVGEYEIYADNPKIRERCQAELKIGKLIEIGYGGQITNEEWDMPTEKYVIGCFAGKIKEAAKVGHYHFIAFHTPEQREEFISHESNMELIKKYYMK